MALKLNQPNGFYTIALGEMFERFSYYGAQTILVLYLTQLLSFNDKKSYTLYGAYATFAYALPIIGGIVADRLLGLKQSIIIGCLMLIAGNVLMAMQQTHSFYIGLTLTVCGIGLYKPNSTNLVGQLYSRGDSKRESGFTLFYMGMNIGAAASPFVYGFTQPWGFQYGYLISATLLFIAWLLFIINIRNIDLSQIQKNGHLTQFPLNKNLLAYCIILITLVAVNALFTHPMLIDSFMPIFSCVAFVSVIAAIMQRAQTERKKLLALLLLSIFGMCFFAASLQVGSSINLFIQRDVNRTLFGHQISTIVFTSLYPAAVIFFAPIMAITWAYLSNRRKEPSAPTKLGLGLLLVSIGFACFTAAAFLSKQDFSSQLPLVWILLGNLALGIGEICLMPAMFSAISQLAPINLQSTMMGVWFLFTAFGGYLSSLVAKLSDHTERTVSTTNKIISTEIYSQTFIEVSTVTFGVAILLFLLTPWIKSLMKSN